MLNEEEFLYTEIRGGIHLINSFDLLSGYSGYLILLYHLEKFDELYNAIEKILNNIDGHLLNYKYSSGITGLLWSLEYINSYNNISYLDELIFELSETLINNIRLDINTIDFDFLHGSTGIVHYLSDFRLNKKSTKLIKDYLILLDRKSIKNNNEYSLLFHNAYKNTYSRNFSISHGLSAIIQVLSRIYKMGFETSLSKKLLEGYVQFLLNNRQDVDVIGSNFPNTLETKLHKSRLAWCYGDLGIAISIWQAGENLGNIHWKNEAEKILIQTTKRKTLSDTMIVDPMICHGTAGIATIYNRMWRNTGLNLFLEARNYWLDETKKFAKFEDGIAGYKYYLPDRKRWVTSYGLLEGVIGIALTFLTANRKEDIRWDRLLLISQ